MRALSFLLLLSLLVGCGDDDATPDATPPFDGGPPGDAGPLLDGGPLDHPRFECTIGADAPAAAFTATIAGARDIAVMGGDVFADETAPAADGRVVVSTGERLEIITADGTTAMDGDYAGSFGLSGQSDGRLFVATPDRVQVVDAQFMPLATTAGDFGSARAIAVDASGRLIVAGDDEVRLATDAGEFGRIADESNGDRGDVAPLALALDEARDRIYVGAEASIEVFRLTDRAHVARVDGGVEAGASGLAVDRFGFVYFASGSDLVILEPDSLREVDRWSTGLSDARVAIGDSFLALLGSDGAIAVYPLGEVQSRACIAQMRIIAPPRMLDGHVAQARVEITGPSGAIDRLSFRRAAQAQLGSASSDFFVYSGVGVAAVRPEGVGEATLTVQAMGFSASAMVDVIAPPAGDPTTGELVDLDWGPDDGVIHLAGTSTVPSGATLNIAAGTIVLMETGALLEVDGNLIAAGTVDAPISIVGPASGETWSQIHHRGEGGVYDYDYTFVAGGGNHADEYTYRRWKHCCPPVLYIETGTFTMDESVIGDTVNKALMVSDGDASLTGCAVQRVGMGPEFEAPTVRVNDVWVSEVRGIDDNDGIYFWKVGQCCAVPTDVCTISCGAPYPQTDVQVDGLVLADGDDDALDTQMSFASVGGDTHPMSPILRNVIIYGWADKGMSLAGGNSVMDNVLSVRNRNLGIKADDNDPRSDEFPDVLFAISRSTIADNANHGLFFGVQGGMTDFGDGSHMTMSVDDSIIFGNPENVFRQYDVSTFTATRCVFPGAIGEVNGVIDNNPVFIDAAGGDYRVSPVSPAHTLIDGSPAGFTPF